MIRSNSEENRKTRQIKKWHKKFFHVATFRKIGYHDVRFGIVCLGHVGLDRTPEFRSVSLYRRIIDGPWIGRMMATEEN